MLGLFRQLYNLFYKSSHRFGDGSGLYHMIRYDIIRYYTGEPVRRIVDVPLTYDEKKRMSKIDTNASWKWRDSRIPLTEWSNSGPELSKNEKFELIQKLRFFVAKQRKHFELAE
jgi:hypothetical protein